MKITKFLSEKIGLSKLKLSTKGQGKKRLIILIIILTLAVGSASYSYVAGLRQSLETSQKEKDKSQKMLEEVGKELEELKNQDQVKRNEELKAEIENIQKSYSKAIGVHDSLVELRRKTDNTGELEALFADALFKLSQSDYSGADDALEDISARIVQVEERLAASFTIPQEVPQNNAPPGSGYSRQTVNVEGLGNYLVSIVAADLSSTRVIVDTAATSDCENDCPVLPLSEYVSRNGAYAGVNGSYFCPADYASCAGRTNSFDLLVMNKDKTYFNSGNNVYSNNPAVIFGENYIRFVTAASQWGRDTSPNGVLSNFPLLVFSSQVVFGGDDDPKKGSKGGRSFVANQGNTVYIGVVHSATVAESARVLHTLGMENAMNLDNGGSTALWSGGYKVGPGRNLPNVILFVSK